MKAIRITETGGPDVLKYVDLPTPKPGPNEVLVKAHSIGVCMPEIYVRKGVYAWMPKLPAIPGIEMSGTVVETGSGCTQLRVGQKVFVCAREFKERANCYAEYIAGPESRIYAVPDGVDLDEVAGLANYQVAWHLLNSALKGFQYESVLVLAAEGKGFCAGQDLNDRLSQSGDTPVLGSALEAFYTPLIRRLRAMPFPVVAAVNGVAAGAGCRSGAIGTVRTHRDHAPCWTSPLRHCCRALGAFGKQFVARLARFRHHRRAEKQNQLNQQRPRHLLHACHPDRQGAPHAEHLDLHQGAARTDAGSRALRTGDGGLG